tara:strand:- start:21 stop:146 length:126 start_codon:yes stop_codon:yes gene_type:complete
MTKEEKLLMHKQKQLYRHIALRELRNLQFGWSIKDIDSFKK